MTTFVLAASFNMPWYFWLWIIIVWAVGWPTLLPPSFFDPTKEEFEIAKKHQIPATSALVTLEAIRDPKVRREQLDQQRRITNRLLKGEKILEGDPDYEFYQKLKEYVRENNIKYN